MNKTEELTRTLRRELSLQTGCVKHWELLIKLCCGTPCWTWWAVNSTRIYWAHPCIWYYSRRGEQVEQRTNGRKSFYLREQKGCKTYHSKISLFGIKIILDWLFQETVDTEVLKTRVEVTLLQGNFTLERGSLPEKELLWKIIFSPERWVNLCLPNIFSSHLTMNCVSSFEDSDSYPFS